MPRCEDLSSSSSLSLSDSWRKRSTATLRCRGVSHRTVPGLSGTKLHAHTATSMLGKPSRRNSSLQGLKGPLLASLVMSHASAPAKAEERGLAEMKSPVLKASSRRRKKKER